jgi:hypothetical protein
MTFTAGQRVTAAALNGNTFQQLQTTTLSGTQTSVILTVPTGTAYNFLTVKWRVRGATAVAGEQMWLQLNGDSGNNYLWQINQANNATVAGSASGAAVAKIQIATTIGSSATANYFASGSFEIGGASDTANFKTVQGTATAYSSTTSSWGGTYAGQWNSTAAVTSITLFPQGASGFAAGCIFTLFGSS